MAKDYFIIEHEGHIQPVPDAVAHKHEADFKKFEQSCAYLGRFIKPDIEGIKKGMADKAAGIVPKPEPAASLDVMNAAGVDVCMLVPHWHALHMNLEHKGTPNDWVIQACEQYPDRLMPGPVFRPSIVGVRETMKEMEYLVTKKGVKFCKIYPPGEKWNMSDERYFPVYALAQELGLVIAFHTGHGYIYGANTEAAHPRHLEKVCRNFYDLKILAYHFGYPFQDELNMIAGAYPNLYIGMSFLNQTVSNRPRFFAKMLGEALMFAGTDKVCYGNDALYGIKMHIEDFRKFQFPQDLIDGYGYKALTTEDKAKLFGLNFAKLIGIEPRKRVD